MELTDRHIQEQFTKMYDVTLIGLCGPLSLCLRNKRDLRCIDHYSGQSLRVRVKLLLVTKKELLLQKMGRLRLTNIKLNTDELLGL